jgi:NADPH:quinone reductase-like Zn-dependent oxidoreductase
MKAIRAHARGGPERLAYEDVPRPDPRAGEALVRVRAVGITSGELSWDATWVDALGHDRTPIIPGHEVAGIVEAVGHGVVSMDVGDRVFGRIDPYRDGAAAEYVAVPARHLARLDVALDAALDDIGAAAVALSGLTAWQALVEQADLSAGQRVLIHGGAGGVGSAAVQIARALGAQVTATASGVDRDYVRGLGADVVIDHRAGPWDDHAAGFDVVLDTLGGGSLVRSAKALLPRGVLVSIVDPPPASFVTRFAIRPRFFIVEPDRAGLEALLRLVREGTLRPQVAAVYPLDRGREGYQVGLVTHRRGKVVISVGD